ncbi:thioester reductase domain-containing protein [Porphyrobacter sp. ULC335]|uniref:thioester reductase domain-containing protein n=1 Tax=Porphyrobacter sp. ULC335 TaxID=2854260 RepID=UPI00221FCBC2|nr:thioester reductase domain-containing protein [Porphyrobacter sp. ULC335]UYV16642.1 thioester reductase domain-containing protein [Porphyrobacter sp. ULC335]
MSAETLIDPLTAQAIADPGRVLFTFSDSGGTQRECMTTGDLLGRAAGIATELERAGVAAGDRVLLVHPPGLELVAALFGAMRIGVLAAIAPVTSVSGMKSEATRSRIAAIRQDCNAGLALGLAQQAGPANDLGLDFLATDSITANGEPSGRPGPIAFLQYTSGSTRQPRGVAVRHDNIIANARALIDHPPIGATWLPMFHDMGLIGHYLFPVVLGGANHAISAQDFLRRPLTWLRLVTCNRATYAATPPFGLELVLEHLARDPAITRDIDLSSLRVLMLGAEPISPDLMDRATTQLGAWGLRPGVLVAAYGLAEATLAVTRGGSRSQSFDPGALSRGLARVHGQGKGRRLASCGTPVEGTSVIIREPASHRILPAGKIGEICVSGAAVTPFYWHDRDKLPSPTLETGDLGFFYQGELYVCGRADDVMIQRGANHHPQDIEAILEGTRCAAFNDELGRATLLVESPPPATPARIRDMVAAATGLDLDRVVIAAPRSVRRTTSGKVARRHTAASLREGPVRVVSDTIWTSKDQDDVLAWLTQRIDEAPDLLDEPLAATGITSLQLVELQLSLEQLAEQAGVGTETPLIDGLRIQAASNRMILELADALKSKSAVADMFRDIAIFAERAQDQERAQMRTDACLELPPLHTAGSGPPEAILLVGATGFFGPHLLSALLRMTRLPVIVMARSSCGQTAQARVLASLIKATPHAASLASRIEVIETDLGAERLGLPDAVWRRLQRTRLAIYHNAATVDYVRTYDALRPANVIGTKALLDLALGGNTAQFHYVSTTFIFGWTRKPVLFEGDANHAMTGLDFGYSQSKWVAERLALRARAQGLPVTIYRPSLISVPESLQGASNDVAARLLAFMINHRVAVDTPNQLSLVPVDVTANNLAALSLQSGSRGATYHLTADRYYSMTALTREIARGSGIRFDELSIPEFLRFLNDNARASDPVFPLLDFFNRCAPQISQMTLKRYDNRAYRAARDNSPWGMRDPELGETSWRLVRFVEEMGWVQQSVGREVFA